MHGPGWGPVKAGDCRGKGECTAQGGDLLKLEIAAEKVSAGPGRGPVKAGERSGKGEWWLLMATLNGNKFHDLVLNHHVIWLIHVTNKKCCMEFSY